jgi:hypothetical protein
LLIATWARTGSARARLAGWPFGGFEGAAEMHFPRFLVRGPRSAVCGLQSAVRSMRSAVCSMRSAVCGLGYPSPEEAISNREIAFSRAESPESGKSRRCRSISGPERAMVGRPGTRHAWGRIVKIAAGDGRVDQSEIFPRRSLGADRPAFVRPWAFLPTTPGVRNSFGVRRLVTV